MPATLVEDAGGSDTDDGDTIEPGSRKLSDSPHQVIHLARARRRDAPLVEHRSTFDQRRQDLGAADIDRQDRLAHRPAAPSIAVANHDGDVLGPGDRRADHHRKGTGLESSGGLLRVADAPFRHDMRRQLAQLRHQLEIGVVGLRATGVARERAADDIGASRQCGDAIGKGGAIGHGQSTSASDRLDHVRDRRRSGAQGGVEGDDVRTGLAQRQSVIDRRRDAHGRVGAIALDEANDRRAVACRTARRLARPSIRRPAAPPSSAASAMPTTMETLSSGPPGTGWQETTSRWCSFSRSNRAAPFWMLSDKA